jgi:hypothetical protein
VVVLWDARMYADVRRELEKGLKADRGFVFDPHYANHCAVLEKRV